MDAEFAGIIVGHSFRHRALGSDLILARPTEMFLAGGRYELHRSRTIAYGTYVLRDGIVTIEGPGTTFLGLGNRRVFFRDQGKVFTIDANLRGQAIELIPNL